MKTTFDDSLAEKLLREGFKPSTGLPVSESEHDTLIQRFTEYLDKICEEKFQSSTEDHIFIYDPYQEENMIRTEVISWELATGGLITDIQQFLATHARDHAVCLTFDFDDELHYTESPYVCIFFDNCIASMKHCKLEDTAANLGLL